MNAVNHANHYLRKSIETASPAKLIVLVYDHILRNLKLAKNALSVTNFRETSDHLIKAQELIRELRDALNMDVKEISPQLHQLYTYFLKQLIVANTQRIMAPIDKVLGHMTDLRETWHQIANGGDIVRNDSLERQEALRSARTEVNQNIRLPNNLDLAV